MEIDIQIYITNIRNFFETNEQAREQMFNIPYADEKMFYEGLEEVATKNYETHGDPTLTKQEISDLIQDVIQQNIRNELKELIAKDMVKIVDVNDDGTPILKVTPKGIKEIETPEGPFQEIPGYGFMGLN
tara:strand:+ start:4223 stop:4612 length:390 start_codon:yes stop_codon:yes gene_type:complete